jgi:hypothetical protein
MSTTYVSDEVWADQDPAAAGLPRRTVALIGVAALVLLAVVIAVPVLIREGAFAPQLAAADRGWNGEFVGPDGAAQPAISGGIVTSAATSTVSVHNNGWPTERILAVTVTGPGFRFDHATFGDTHTDGDLVHPGGYTVSAAHIVTLGGGEDVDLTLFVRITDCRAVPAGPLFATLRVDSWRGVRSVRVVLPTVRHFDGGWAVTGPTDPAGVNPIRYLADAVCAAPAGR